MSLRRRPIDTHRDESCRTGRGWRIWLHNDPARPWVPWGSYRTQMNSCASVLRREHYTICSNSQMLRVGGCTCHQMVQGSTTCYLLCQRSDRKYVPCNSDVTCEIACKTRAGASFGARSIPLRTAKQWAAKWTWILIRTSCAPQYSSTSSSCPSLSAGCGVRMVSPWVRLPVQWMPWPKRLETN